MGQIREFVFEGSMTEIVFADLAEEVREAMRGTTPPGEDAYPHIKEFMQRVEVRGNREDCADYLRGYGAWSNEELHDHQMNLFRLVWLTCAEFNEGIERSAVFVKNG